MLEMEALCSGEASQPRPQVRSESHLSLHVALAARASVPVRRPPLHLHGKLLAPQAGNLAEIIDETVMLAVEQQDDLMLVRLDNRRFPERPHRAWTRGLPTHQTAARTRKHLPCPGCWLQRCQCARTPLAPQVAY